MWRQLTSMRTALILLLLLALASIPGSIFPQRGNNPLRVDQWFAENPRFSPFFDWLGFFDVYSSPWFAAVYLLLFVSLVGCVLPRSWHYWLTLRAPIPPAPRRLERLPACIEVMTDAAPADVIAKATEHLKSGRWRTRLPEPATTDAWVAAEKGYLREVGNLVFHLSLIVLLVGVAVGGLFGWKGNVIVKEGDGFSNTLTQYDAWGGGRFVDPGALAPFSFTLNDFTAEFQRGDAERGSPTRFEADVTYQSSPLASAESTLIEVNEPLEADGAKVFLVGHGYAPRFVVTDSTGKTVFDDTVVFLPQDGAMTSTGVVKIPDATPSMGLNAIFAPTASVDAVRGPFSTFPSPDYPAVFLAAFTGDLGLDSGKPQSIYTLKTDNLTQVGLTSLLPGQTWTLDDGLGTVAFTGFERWASFQIAYDPGKEVVLVSAVAAMLGLLVSLFVKRRRLWVRSSTLPDGRTHVQVAGLAKSDGYDVTGEVEDLARHLGRAPAELR
jgi:cytochrome c biogenesis protein